MAEPKGIHIYQNDLFGKNILEMLGFPATAPTCSGPIEEGGRLAGHEGKGTGSVLTMPGIESIEILKGEGEAGRAVYFYFAEI